MAQEDDGSFGEAPELKVAIAASYDQLPVSLKNQENAFSSIHSKHPFKFLLNSSKSFESPLESRPVQMRRCFQSTSKARPLKGRGAAVTTSLVQSVGPWSRQAEITTGSSSQETRLTLNPALKPLYIRYRYIDKRRFHINRLSSHSFRLSDRNVSGSSMLRCLHHKRQ